MAPKASLYARAMTPVDPRDPPAGMPPFTADAGARGDPPPGTPAAYPSAADSIPEALAASGLDVADAELAARVDRAGKGLATWLLLLLVFGVGGLLLHMEELSFMLAIAGLFVLAQAADADARWRYLHYAVSWVTPAAGLVIAVVIGAQIFVHDAVDRSTRIYLAPALLVSALACVLTAFRPVANVVATLLFRSQRVTHTLRLAARITLITLALALPGWFALQSVFDEIFDPSKPLIDRAALEGQLVGYVLLALAGVGWLVRRDLREAMRRLGLGRITASHLAIVALGVVSLYGINAGADWMQRAFFPGLWDADHQVNQMIASGLGVGKIALLGVSAGVGEEITLRGALQPRLGLVLTSLLFASLHLQYSWFGIGVIFLLGLVLGTIRLKTNTTVAMAVHAIYDIAALVSA